MVTTRIELLSCHRDTRGVVFEPLDSCGLLSQRNVHVVLTEPGKIRGNHYHASGTEVIVLVGPALARIRESGQTKEIHISPGEVVRFIIPPGIPHAFKNTGSDISVLVAFNSVAHDPARPDTFPFVLIGDDEGEAMTGADCRHKDAGTSQDLP